RDRGEHAAAGGSEQRRTTGDSHTTDADGSSGVVYGPGNRQDAAAVGVGPIAVKRSGVDRTDLYDGGVELETKLAASRDLGARHHHADAQAVADARIHAGR